MEIGQQDKILPHVAARTNAVTLCRRSVRMLETALGAKHPDLANVLNTLGVIHEDRTEYGKAEECYQRSVEIMVDMDDDGDIDLIRIQSWVHLAGIHRVQGKYTEAEPLYRRALAYAEKKLGSDDPEVSSVLNDLAVLYKYTGKFAKAERLYRRALAITEKTLGPQNPQVATIYHNLGGLEHSVDVTPLVNRSPAGRSRFVRMRGAGSPRRCRRHSRAGSHSRWSREIRRSRAALSACAGDL